MTVQPVCVWRSPSVFPGQKPEHTSGEAAFWREWGPEYVKRLRRGVKRHSGLATVCVTDDPTITEPTVPLIGPGRGWWAKMDVLNPSHRFGDVLYLDLDNVVCGDLAPLLDVPADPLVMNDDKIYPGLPNGAVYRAHVPDLTWLWQDYLIRAPVIHLEYQPRWPRGADQSYLAESFQQHYGRPVPLLSQHVPAQTLLNARSELERGVPVSTQTCVVFGSWRPKPHESRHPFYAEHWAA